MILDVSAAPTLWPWLLAAHRAAVLPVDGDGLIGAGPFRVVRLDGAAREPLELAAYPRHHRGRPLLDAIVYRRFDNPRALAFAHRHQGVDVVDLTAAVTDVPPVALGSATETLLLRLNADRSPLDSRALRERIDAAIGRVALVDVVLGGRAQRSDGILHPRPPAAIVESSSSARAPADSKVAAVSRSLTLVYPIGMELEDIAERIIRVDLRGIGIRARAQPLDPSALARALASREFDLALVVHPGGGVPSALALAELCALLGCEPSPSLRRAVRETAAAPTPVEVLFAAEGELLGGAELSILLARERRLFARESVRGAGSEPGASAILESAWRWPPP